MWGANKWTDQMLKKYWWVVIVFALLYIIYKTL